MHQRAADLFLLEKALAPTATRPSKLSPWIRAYEVVRMPSANVTANAALVIGLLLPFIVALMPNYKWLLWALLTVGALFTASLWIIGAAVDAEAAKPRESLDAQLGYAIDFWEVVIAGSLFAVSTAVKTCFLDRNQNATRID